MLATRLRALAVVPFILLGLACASGQERPGTAAADAMPDGPTLFARHCASCHGFYGEGDGPVAAAMEVAVPNLRTLTARSNGTFPRDTVMQYIDGRNLPAAHGSRLMPVWGDTFAASAEDPATADEFARRQIAAIADFLVALQH